jgi:hypothetical protein
MPYCEFREWIAYFSIERANYSQMEINIARIARDINNKTYVKQLQLDSFLELEKKNDDQKEISIKLKHLSSMVKKAGKQ